MGRFSPLFKQALRRRSQVKLAIVKRSDHAKGFGMLPRSWIVERTIGWINRCGWLAKDWENTNRKALAFLRLASIQRMLRNYAIPSNVTGYSLRTLRP